VTTPGSTRSDDRPRRRPRRRSRTGRANLTSNGRRDRQGRYAAVLLAGVTASRKPARRGRARRLLGAAAVLQLRQRPGAARVRLDSSSGSRARSSAAAGTPQRAGRHPQGTGLRQPRSAPEHRTRGLPPARRDGQRRSSSSAQVPPASRSSVQRWQGIRLDGGQGPPRWQTVGGKPPCLVRPPAARCTSDRLVQGVRLAPPACPRPVRASRLLQVVDRRGRPA